MIENAQVVQFICFFQILALNFYIIFYLYCQNKQCIDGRA